jgi:hypothetical protein
MIGTIEFSQRRAVEIKVDEASQKMADMDEVAIKESIEKLHGDLLEVLGFDRKGGQDIVFKVGHESADFFTNTYILTATYTIRPYARQ